MKTLVLFISLSVIALTSYSQAWVWEKPLSTTSNVITTDVLENIIVIAKKGTATQLSKFTKDGLPIWTQKLSKAGTFTAGGSIVTDNNGNIYTFTDGFDSVNSVFTGVKLKGITKFDPQGHLLWHVPYYASSVSSALNKLPIQIDNDGNIYAAFYDQIPGPSVNINLGSTSIPAPGSGSNFSYLSVASISPAGTSRWFRVFKFQTSNSGYATTTGFSIAGTKLIVAGHMAKEQLFLDAGVTITVDRCSAWIAGIDCSNGQSIWGKSHNLYVYCLGTYCDCGNPSVYGNSGTGKFTLTKTLNGGFVFSGTDTIRSIINFGDAGVKTYFTIYDTLGTPIKGDTIQTVPDQFSYAENIVGGRGNSLFSVYQNFFRKKDTGYHLIWQKPLTGLTVWSVFVPQNSNGILFTYSRNGNEYFAKMSDSAAVISGKTYADWDNNGIYTNTDSVLNNVLITTNSSIASSISTSDSGKYYLYATPGSYTVHANFNHPYYQFVPSSYTVNIAQVSDTVTNKDFRLRPLFNFTDVGITFSALDVARPGHYSNYVVTAKNYGAAATTILTGLKLPPLTTYGGISGGNIIVNAPDSITISSGSIDPFASKQTIVTLFIATTATITDTLKFYPKANPYTTDTLKNNNLDTLFQPIRTSFDPNEKEVNFKYQPISDSSKALVYTVHFQNTGNDTAFYVRVADTLSSRVDPTSFRFIDASHTVTTEIRNNILSFIFNPILLPDSNHNELQSHGYVKFSIKPMSPVTVSDTIFNKAAIYFDYNSPVITNSTKSWYYSGTIPVVLQSFVAEKTNTNVLLKFTTASEQNLSRFIIERSFDGINFSPIGMVNAKGNSSIANAYSFLDINPGKPTDFYRLRMEDKDGKLSYSWTLVVRFVNAAKQITVFPNPAGDNLYINLKDVTTGKIFACTLADITGKKIWTSDLNPALRSTYSINTASLSNGIYYVSITGNGTVYQQKIVIKH